MTDQRNEIQSQFDQIINKTQTTLIFSNKCTKFSSIFDEMKIVFNQSKPKLKSEKRLKDCLSSFLQILDNLNNKEWCINFLKRGKTIESYLVEIGDCIQSIYNCMKKKYSTHFSFPIYNIFEDVKQIKSFLSDPQFQDENFQKRRKEVEKYYRKNIKYFTDIMDKFDKKKEYRLNPNDYIKKEQLFQGKLFQSQLFEYFEGEMKKTKQKIIITVLKDKEQFKTLFHIYSSIDHPCIEQFVGVSVTDSSIEFVTTLRGEPFENVIQKSNVSLTIIAFKIAEAMSYLHSKMIVFGDLNLSNIFIENFDDEDPTKVTPIITNFSNSIILKTSSFLKTPNIIKSSPFYAPELISNYKCDEKVDVFDFSRLIFQFLEEKCPFEGQNEDDIKRLLIDGKRPDFKQDNLIKNIDIVSLIKRCWDQKSIERYSFDQIVQEMINCGIVFPSDESRSDKIKPFYNDKIIKSQTVITCLNLFDTIISNISGVHQFKLEFRRALPFLANYKYLLHHSDYASSLNESSKMKDLENKLDFLYSIVHLARIQDVLSWFNDKEINYVTKNLTDSMQYIHTVMTDLGFKVTKYQEDKNDIIMDYYELECYFREQGINDLLDERKEQIDNFLREKKIPIELKEKNLNPALKNLLSSFSSSMVDRGDFYYRKIRVDDGTSSNVYEGYCISSKKRVAIKIIKDDYLEQMKNLINIRREINYLVKLNHKYLIKFVGFSISEEKGKRLWIVSQFINDNLFYIKNELNAFQKTKIAFEIAEGMEYLHYYRILHRDLKPLNILLTKNLIAKIIDFGYCVADLHSITRTNGTGTPNYMAPEVIQGKPYGRAADVFSFGFSLWELYYGDYPFKNLSNSSIVDLIINNIRPKIGKKCPKPLKNLIIDCWNMDPNLRPSFSQIIDRMIDEKICFPEIIGLNDNNKDEDNDDNKEEDDCNKEEDDCNKEEDDCNKEEDDCNKEEDDCKKEEDDCNKEENGDNEKEDDDSKEKDDCNKEENDCNKEENDDNKEENGDTKEEEEEDDDEREFNKIDNESLPLNTKIDMFYVKKSEIRRMNGFIQGYLD